MAKVVETIDTSASPAEYSGFDKLEIREYDGSGAKHLYGVNEVDGRVRSTHLNLGRYTTVKAGVEVVPPAPPNYEAQLSNLEASVQQLQEGMENLQRQLSEITAERDRLKEENSRLSDELAVANKHSTEFEEGYIGQAPGFDDDGGIVDGWTVISRPYFNGRGVKVIDIEKDGMRGPVNYESFVGWQDEEVKIKKETRRIKYDEGFRARLKRQFNGGSAPPEYVFLDDYDRPYYVADDGETVYVESTEDGGGGKALGVAALIVGTAALFLASCESLDDEDKDSRTSTTVIQENERMIKVEEDRLEVERDLLEAEQKQADEAEEANDIARDLLRAEKYENRLSEKENRLRLEQLRAQQYANRLDREEAAREKRTLSELSVPIDSSHNQGENLNGAANTIVIEQGHGYTYELRDIFPGYSGKQYFHAHQAAVEKFGVDYVSNVPKYTTAKGDIRFGRPGEALIRPSVRNFVQDYLKSH